MKIKIGYSDFLFKRFAVSKNGKGVGCLCAIGIQSVSNNVAHLFLIFLIAWVCVSDLRTTGYVYIPFRTDRQVRIYNGKSFKSGLIGTVKFNDFKQMIVK